MSRNTALERALLPPWSLIGYVFNRDDVSTYLGWVDGSSAPPPGKEETEVSPPRQMGRVSVGCWTLLRTWSEMREQANFTEEMWR